MYMRYIFSAIGLILSLTFCLSCSADKGSRNNDSGINTIEASGDNDKKTVDAYFGNKEEDVAKLEGILKKAKDIKDINERVVAITQEFIGVPYAGATLNIPEQEALYVSTSGVDCSTFVEIVIALALASERENPDINDFLGKLQSIRYRGGQIDGYPSRLHYISEWSIDNARRGNFKEIGGECPLAETRVKTIDFMTKNRQLYPALKDEKVLEAVKANEKALKDLRFSFIPGAQVENAAKDFLKSGDIVAIVTEKPGLDVSHVGVINVKNGIPYLIHASSKYKKVVNDTVPLKVYLNRQKSPGIRVFRLPGA